MQDSRCRKLHALKYALGQDVLEAFEDTGVDEIMVNPDGAIWIDRSGAGRVATDKLICPRDLERAIRLLADMAGATVNRRRPHVSGAMPFGKGRFQGEIPPATSAPLLTIRKLPSVSPTLEQLVASGALQLWQYLRICQALTDRLNILVAGGTSSGKTTFANALITAPSVSAHRLVIIEDTPELRSEARDVVHLRTRTEGPLITTQDLVRISLRLRPDRIIVGELRDHSALDLIKAWNTGHPGGVATVHANSARDALARLESLIAEGPRTAQREVLLSAVNLIVFMERRDGARMVTDIARPVSWSKSGWKTMRITQDKTQLLVD